MIAFCSLFSSFYTTSLFFFFYSWDSTISHTSDKTKIKTFTSLIHFSVILSPSLYPSGFGSLIPSLFCHYVFFRAPECSPLALHIRAILRVGLRADSCCIHPPLLPPP